METIVVFFLLLAGTAHSLDFESCDQEDGVVPISFYVYKCFSQPCTFLRGNNTTGNVKFAAVEDTKKIETVVEVDHHGSMTKIAGDGVHKCSGFQEGECGYEAGTTINYFFLFPVYLETPKEDILHFKMTLKNENGTALTCVKFNGRIVDRIEVPSTTVSPDEE